MFRVWTGTAGRQIAHPRVHILWAIADQSTHFYERWAAFLEPPSADKSKADMQLLGDISFRH